MTCVVGTATIVVVAWRCRWSGSTGTAAGGGLAPTALDGAKGRVVTTNGELAGSTVVVERGTNFPRGITTDGVAAVSRSPPAHAGAARASSARIAITPFRIMAPRSTGASDILFRLTSESCSARRPTSTRPTGHSRGPTGGGRRGPPAPAARGLPGGSPRRDPPPERRTARPHG